MAAKLRHIVSNVLPEQAKYRISMAGSKVTYWVASLLKGLSPLWNEDDDFRAIYPSIRDRVLLDPARCLVLLQVARNQIGVDGDIVEIGSYRCGSALLLTANDTAAAKTLHIIDTFEGLPDVSSKDPYWTKGEMGGTDFAEIQRYLESHIRRTNYQVHRGYFPDQIDLDELRKPWSLVHIDTDLYQPTLDALRFFYPLMSPGGVIIVDDYGNSSCPGVVDAVSEFETEKNLSAIFLISGQALIYVQPGK